jgi:Tfp pilus assembly protein PilF
VLGGLPLAHEQAAAYCERIGVSLSDYLMRFDATPTEMLDDVKDASQEYHDGRTVAKTFALAIEEAGKLHPGVEPLITYAALLAPEPIPLFLFTEGSENLSEPFASTIAGDGLNEAVGVLRAFTLVDRESIPDERDPSITTDCIRLHRLVREVAAARSTADGKGGVWRELIAAASIAYPGTILSDPATWPRARRLDAVAMALVSNRSDLPDGSEPDAAILLAKLDIYRGGVLGAYAEAQVLCERALAIREKALGPEHPDTIRSINNLGYLLDAQGNFAGSRSHYERALAIREKTLGPEHPDTAGGLNNLGALLQAQGDAVGARLYLERALTIREKSLDPQNPSIARSLNNLGYLIKSQGDLAGARQYYERALEIHEKVQGPEHPDTATCLNNLGGLLDSQGDLAGARQYYERALAIRERTLGPEHPDTATILNNLGFLMNGQNDLAGALSCYERALGILEKTLGAAHPTTKITAGNRAIVLEAQGHRKEAKALRRKFGIAK